jgi:hypothetical protein
MKIQRIDPWKKCGRNDNRFSQSETCSDESGGPASPDPSIYCEYQVEIWACFLRDVADYRTKRSSLEKKYIGY